MPNDIPRKKRLRRIRRTGAAATSAPISSPLLKLSLPEFQVGLSPSSPLFKLSLPAVQVGRSPQFTVTAVQSQPVAQPSDQLIAAITRGVVQLAFEHPKETALVLFLGGFLLLGSDDPNRRT